MAHPSRRRDDPYAQDDYYGRNPPYWDAGEPPAGPPPRRSKSERHRDPPEDRGASRRHRDDGAARGSSHRHGDGRHARSPPPSYQYDDRRGGDPRRDPRDHRDARDPRDSRDPRDARGMRDPRASRNERDYPPRGDRYDDEPRGLRRSKTAEPDRYRRSSLDHKSRDYPPRDDRDRDHDRRGGYAKTRGRDPSPAHGGRTKTRDFADGPDRDGGRDRDRHGGHSSRSHAKDKALTKDVAAAEPSRGRDKNTAPSGGGGARGFGGKVRSATMPAAQTAAKWWQNPLVQAGARTALSAGATAAMNNRGAQGEWLGAKGAKVATAALGAALMDGFMGGGQKKDQGGGGGGDARGRERSSSRDRDRSRDRGGKSGGGRSKSEGRGGDMKQRIMQSGMEYMMKKAAAR